jgi:monovalent cation:H+ antiporter-2, CPA2 family
MFTLARWGGKAVSRIFATRDDELFTVLFFGLAVMFGGIGDLLGVTDAIGAFVIGLLCGATRYRDRIEQLALPMRDVFAAFFFVNFGLGLDVATFGEVLWPVLGAILMTVVLNAVAGQIVARMNGFGMQQGINTAVILVNRGEFALILATLSAAAGLEARITAFAGLYVLVMAILGPVLAANSDRIGRVVSIPARRRLRGRALAQAQAAAERRAERDRMFAEEIALVEAAGSDERENGRPEAVRAEPESAPASPTTIDIHAEQAGQQSDARANRQRDPEY